MRISTSMRWLVVVAGAAMLLAVAAACAGETVEVPGETVVVEKEVIKEVMVPGETVVVEKEVVKTVEVPGPERVVVKEVPSGKNYVTDPVTGKVYSAPEWGGTMTIGIRVPKDSVDPAVGGAANVIGMIVNEKLGQLNWALDRDDYSFTGGYMTPVYALVGALAESWETPDDTTMIFNIRQGVQWHDKAPMNGRELTAEDVEYNFHRALGLGKFADLGPWPSVGEFGAVAWESIEATDDSTVVMKLNEPSLRALRNVLDWHSGIMLPPEVIEEHGDISDWRNLVGTGPYEFTDWVKDSSREFTKNPNYWGFDPKYPENRLPYLDKIQLLLIPEESTRQAGMRSGKLDYIGHPGATQVVVVDQALSLMRTNPELQVYPWSQRSNSGAHMNVTKPPFNDIRVRRAMQMALDLETMNNTYFKGFSDWIPRGLVGRGAKGFLTPYEEWPEELKKGYMYDPEGAEALLDEAGLTRGADGIRFKTEFMHLPVYPLGWTEFMVSYWREIGIEVDIEIPELAEWVARRKAKDFEVQHTSTGFELDPMGSAMNLFYSKGTSWTTVVDAQYDAWYEAALAATTDEEQMGLIKKMDMRSIEQFWFIWGPSGPQFNVAQPWVMGYDGEGIIGGNTNQHLWKFLWIDSEMKEAMGH